jgi:hypothetical protein
LRLSILDCALGDCSLTLGNRLIALGDDLIGANESFDVFLLRCDKRIKVKVGQFAICKKRLKVKIT